MTAAQNVADEAILPRLEVQAIRISNDLYGNDVMSANEPAKGYTRPIHGKHPMMLVPELREAHDKLLAKRKLTLILRSKAVKNLPIHVGDTVQVFIKHQNEKRGKWSDDKPVLSYDHQSRTVTVPGKEVRTIRGVR